MFDFIFVNYNLELISYFLNFLFSNEFTELSRIIKFEFFSFPINDSLKVKIIDLRKIQASKIIEGIFLLVC